MFLKLISFKKNDMIKIASFGLSITDQTLIKQFQIKSQKIIYLGEDLNDIEKCDFIVIKKHKSFSDSKDLKYILINYFDFVKPFKPISLAEAVKAKKNNYGKKIIDFSFFSQKQKTEELNIQSVQEHLVESFVEESHFSELIKLGLGKIND